MKTVSILVPETAVPATIVNPRYLFSAVNMFFSDAGHEPFFEIQLVGMDRIVGLDGGIMSMHPDKLISEVSHTDLIIIPAISGDVSEAIELNTAFLPWIKEQYKQGAEVASLCIGAFLLAATGLVDGRHCSTHWLYASQFRTMFPQVELTDGRIVTDQQGIYSSGGANSHWNLLLYLVEKYTSREMAITASKFFVLDMDLQSQLPFSMFKGQKNHDDEDVLRAQEFIEQHYQERITVDDLSGRFSIGRRTFERRFKKATSNTVIEYIQRVKIEAAKTALEKARKTVNEVMYDVGYSDTKAFRDLFRKVTGLTPMEYRSKFTALR
ncbi:MAG: helix-turn-helix domain-containing protein [Gammaproteobacteria bacterium]